MQYTFWLSPPSNVVEQGSRNSTRLLIEAQVSVNIMNNRAKEAVMPLTEDSSAATHQIHAFSPGKITINGTIFTHSLIISPDRLIEPWRPASIDALTDQDLMPFLELGADIILLGTGEKSVILPAQKLRILSKAQYHAECMNTAAACRTYTALAAEGRKVAAGLIV